MVRGMILMLLSLWVQLTAFIYGYIHYVMKFGAAGSDLQGLNS